MKATGTLTLPQLFALAWAESRGAWKRFVYFIVCLAIGVGAVMTVKSFSVLLENAIHNESKGLLAADLEISGSWALSKEDLHFLDTKLPAGTKYHFIKELHAMSVFKGTANQATGPSPASLLVELKAVPSNGTLYPLYGKLETHPPLQGPFAPEFASAWVEPGFLMRSQLEVGDTFQLGKVDVVIRGVIDAEPDRISRAFSIGPRVMVSLETLKKAELIRPGSRIKHRTRIALPHGKDPQQIAALLERELKDRSINIKTYQDMQDSLSKSVNRMSQYLGSVGVIALLMGGIGVAMIVRTFMAQKLDTIATLNCLGASSKTIFKIYLLQALLLGATGSLIGVTLGYGLEHLLPAKLPGLLNLEVHPEFIWQPALQAMGMGMLTTLLFSLWPLIRAVKTPPLRLFRHMTDDEELARGSRRERWLIGLVFMAGLTGIVFWQAGSIQRAVLFLVAMIVSALLLNLVSRLALFILRRLPPSGRMSRRYGLANLTRPNNQATSIVTALGMGIMLVLCVRLVQSDVIAMLSENTEISPPSFFFIDIQREQKDTFTKIVQDTVPSAEWELIPLIRSRLYSAGGQKAEEWVYKNRRAEEWFIQREFVLTVGGEQPPKDNTVIQGKWWTPAEANTPQVSLEEDAAKRLHVSLGDEVVIDIQGIHVSAPVTSIRKVNWRNMRTNFYMIYSPGALEGAPITYVSTVKVEPEQEMALQKAVVHALPNLTALSTRDIVETIESVTTKLLTLVDFMSAFTITAGLFIFSGAVASTKFRRLKESAILKTLGAKRSTVASILGYEYVTLGIISGSVGVGLSLALSWAVMKYIVKAPWNWQPGMIAFGFLFAIILTTLTGVLSSLDVLRNKPLLTLRQSGV